MLFIHCPIPTARLPINQYQSLSGKKFFRWVTLDRSIYLAKLLAVWVTGLLLTLLIFVAKSVCQDITLTVLLWGALAGKTAVLCCLLRLYLTWHCLYSRLTDYEIVYIPSGETIVWQKPQIMLIRDRLVAEYQVMPLLKRLARSLLVTLLFISLNYLVLSLTIYF